MLLARSLLLNGAGAGSVTPSISSFAVTETQAIACGVNWEAEASWTISNADNTNYYIDFRDKFGVLIAGNLDCANGNYPHVGNTGDPLFSGSYQEFGGYIEIRLRSDNSLVDYTTPPQVVSVDAGPAC